MQIIDIKAETINPSHKSKTLKLEQNGKKKKGGDDQNKTQRISEKKKRKKKLLLALVKGRRRSILAGIVRHESVETVDRHFPVSRYHFFAFVFVFVFKLRSLEKWRWSRLKMTRISCYRIFKSN